MLDRDLYLKQAIFPSSFPISTIPRTKTTSHRPLSSRGGGTFLVHTGQSSKVECQDGVVVVFESGWGEELGNCWNTPPSFASFGRTIRFVVMKSLVLWPRRFGSSVPETTSDVLRLLGQKWNFVVQMLFMWILPGTRDLAQQVLRRSEDDVRISCVELK